MNNVLKFVLAGLFFVFLEKMHKKYLPLNLHVLK
jgi:hypothetical protein